MYLLILPDEDGNPLRWYRTTDELVEGLNDYGINKFRSYDAHDSDPMYWKSNEGMVLKVEVLEPKPVEVVTSWKFDLK